jgi:hypothetical protein
VSADPAAVEWIDAQVRARLAALAIAAAALLGGCGGAPPPDEATSRAQITRVVLDWHRYQAGGDGKAGCALLTKRARYAQGGDDCEKSIERYRRFAAPLRQALRDTEVDEVVVTGDKATAKTHTTATVNGATRTTPPATIPLRWEGGRWKVD